MPYATVTLTGTYHKVDGTAAAGRVDIIPSVSSLRDPDGNVILAGRLSIPLDETGSFTIALPATDDETLNPTGFAYTASVKLAHVRLAAVTFVLPAGLGALDMADVTPAADIDSPTYATLLGPAGPQGSAGAAGAPGSDATVTDSSVAAVIPSPTTRAALTATYTKDQADFVKLVMDNAPRYTSAKLHKTGATTYEARYHDATAKGATYRFIKDTNDDFIKLDACYTGFGYGAVDFFDPTTAALTGTWNTSTASWYTTVVGATFTGTVTGSRIELRLTRESRGGLWGVTVDGVAKANVTVYSVTTVTAFPVIATGLDPAVEHTVVLTFLGNDPANTPSSSPSRGYVRDDVAGTLIGYISDAAATVMILADGSNKEMAFTTDAPAVWIPDHGTGSAFQVAAPVFVIDGTAVDIAGMATGASVAITKSFELRQHFYGRNSGIDRLVFNTTHRLDTAGQLSFSGRLQTLVATLLHGYPLMLSGWDAVTDTFVTGLLNTYVNLGDETTTYLGDESDATYSAAVVSSTNPNVIAAATLSNPRLTYRRGAAAGKPPAGESLFLWNRATKPKLYWHALNNLSLAVGDGYAWSFDLAVAEIDNVRALVA